jgi:DNA-binding CsgD family transcriptional regulator
VFRANAALIVGATIVLALSPATVSWPPAPVEAAELAAWVLGVVLLEFVILRWLFRGQRSLPRRVAPHDQLTAREVEIVQLIAQSFTAKEIAETLFISPKTVDAHRGHILKKLGLKDRVAVTRYAIKHGLVEP